MPLLNDSTLQQNSLAGGHYGYSGTRIEHLGATEYTIVTVACDVSGSTSSFTFDLEAALAQIVQACQLSPRADNLLLRVVQFDDQLDEVHGFKMLENCDLADYGGSLRAGGMTALYDATENAIAATVSYGKSLAAGSFSANAILFVMTDGADNASKLNAKHVKQALANAVRSESLESLVTILVGVNVQDAQIIQYLRAFHQDAGLHHYLEINQANANTLAGLANFVSRSICAQSQVLGTGQTSSWLKF